MAPSNFASLCHTFKMANKNTTDSYLHDMVYGGIDGTVTTFAVVAGVAGADLGIVVLLILGFANLFADGFSMAAANYLSTRTQLEQYRMLLLQDRELYRQDHDKLREKFHRFYRLEGLKDDTIDQIYNDYERKPDALVQQLANEEFGHRLSRRSPMIAALATFIAFFSCGLLPLIPFVFGLPSSFMSAAIVTAIAFFAIGSLRSLWTKRRWWYSGLVTLLVGVLASSLAYLVGLLLHQYLT